MISRSQAVERARAYLQGRGSNRFAYSAGARPNPFQNLWIVEPRDPQHPAVERVDGGNVLVVPSDGPVYEIAYHPGAEELAGLRSPAEVAGLPSDWSEVLDDYLGEFDWWKLIDWLEGERKACDVYPPAADVFAAFRFTPYDDVRVVIIGQDPYPNPGQAHGLCFSVPIGVAKPRSLINIHKLLEADLETTAPCHGNLEGWARQGVLMLNSALTVRREDEGSHLAHWQVMTDAVIEAVSDKPEQVVFVLWGAAARSKAPLIDRRHAIIEAAHPVSRPNARDPFLDSRSFSRANRLLKPPIDWAVADG